MIKTYFIEDITLEQLDSLVEKGECFNLVSKASLSAQGVDKQYRDLFWGFRDRSANDIRNDSAE